MASSTSSERESSAENLSTKTRDELWALPRRRFRAECRTAGGLRPGDEIVAFLVDSWQDADTLMATYCNRGTAMHGAAAHDFWRLHQLTLPRAERVNKRQALLDPAWQRVLLARRSALSTTADAGLQDAQSWLRCKL